MSSLHGDMQTDLAIDVLLDWSRKRRCGFDCDETVTPAKFYNVMARKSKYAGGKLPLRKVCSWGKALSPFFRRPTFPNFKVLDISRGINVHFTECLHLRRAQI